MRLLVRLKSPRVVTHEVTDTSHPPLAKLAKTPSSARDSMGRYTSYVTSAAAAAATCTVGA